MFCMRFKLPKKWDHDAKQENMHFRCYFSGISPTTASIRLPRLSFRTNLKNPEIVVEFARQLVMNTVEHVEQIDEFIRRHAEHWRLDRMATVDRNILRLAVQEFLYDKETPKTVVINEAIEIARRFSAQESPLFINGVLDSIKKELEA